MIKNYLKTAYRNLLRHKGATLVKLAGLSIGMACCMLILVYLADELSYNKFNAHYDGIYRVNFVRTKEGEIRKFATTPNPVGPAIARDLSQVAAVAREYSRSGNMGTGEPVGSRGTGTAGATGTVPQKFEEQNVSFVDSNMLRIFSIHFVEGSAAGALSRPNSTVITTEMAKKYFGNRSALGQSLLYENDHILQVTGVVNKLPAASDWQFDFLVSFETLYSVENTATAEFLRTNWLYNPCSTYLLLNPGQPVALVETALHQLTKKYGDERVQKSYSLSLQPLSAIHLHASNIEGNPSTNNIGYIYIFAGIAALILLIANINFINLSNAQSLTRISEIGIRKVSGAGARQLIAQFLGEGLLLSIAAALVAVCLTALGLPLLNGITDKELRIGHLLHGRIILIYVFLFLCTGFLAGLYPAIFITRFKLTALLKGKTGHTGGGRMIRQSLIVTQFAIAIALIIGAFVIERQLQFLRNKPLGFNKEQLMVLPIFGKGVSPINSGVDGPLRARMNAFEDEIRKYHSVDAVTLSSVLPGEPYARGLVIPEGHVEQDNIFVPWASVDYDFITTLKAPLVAGRDFSKQTGTDHLQAFIVNETAVSTFGWKNALDAIGKNITRGDSRSGKKGHVIGVVKDFNFDKLDRPMEAMIMDVNIPRFTEFAIRVHSDNIPATIQTIRLAWDRLFPERIFEYSFLDENIDAQYKAQESLSKLVGYFAGIAIFLSCIGLFSLASFMAIQRTREIGIRKVLGARTRGIVGLLYRDFFRLVIIALLIASPLAWYMMNGWLHDFAYRIGLSWWIFAAAGAAALMISALTVGWQGWNAARMNPVKSLRE
jgi:putative ABC transport system permease protein